MGPAVSQEITYAKQVAPILQERCVACHRPGQIGPFPLTDYDEASAFAREIKRSVLRRTMPPWKPVNDPSQFQEPRCLSEREIEILSKWVDGGTPAGDPEDLPPPRDWPEGWVLGTPDLVVQPEEGFEVPAIGPDIYRTFALPTHLSEDKWVTAVEIRPGSRRAVHHVQVTVDTSGAALRYDKEDPAPGYAPKAMFGGFLPASEMGGWVPGMTPKPLPEGVGRHLPKGSTLVLDIHYHPSGRREEDRTSLGLTFAKGPIRKRLRWVPTFNMGFEIPPGAKSHVVRAQWVLADNAHLLGVLPHMHYRGKEIKVEAFRPDGSIVNLVEIRDWDIGWQELYFFSKPIPAPKGTKIKLTCVFDNSVENRNNPARPPIPVGWGPNSTDEMALAWVCFTLDREDRLKMPERR